MMGLTDQTSGFRCLFAQTNENNRPLIIQYTVTADATQGFREFLDFVIQMTEETKKSSLVGLLFYSTRFSNTKSFHFRLTSMSDMILISRF